MLNQANQLFRKISLERLSSPEQLDILMRVTSPRAWIGLLAFVCLLVLALLWGIFGSIPSKVSSQCILIKTGGLQDITASSGGRITDIPFSVGDTVVKGQRIARIDQPELLDRLQSTEIRLRELEAQEKQLLSFNIKSSELATSSEAQQRKLLSSQAQAIATKIKALDDKLETQQELLKQGLVTKQSVVSVQLELSGARLENERLKDQIQQLSIRKLEDNKRTERELSQVRSQISEIKRQIDSLLKNTKLSTLVVSQYSGRVVELKVDEGMLVGAGTAIMSLEPVGESINDLQAVIYVDPAEGKKVKNGMIAQIAPSTVKREEYGFIQAKVRHVADYPSTTQGMMRILQNQKLAQQLAGETAPLEVRADLTPDANTRSGYRWSSRAGPPTLIQSGTMCNAEILISAQRPINMVIPYLKKQVGLY